MTWPATLILGWPPKECSPNFNGKLRRRIAAKKTYREASWTIAREAGLAYRGDGLILIEFRFHPPDRRNRDDDNLLASTKAARDGIALALGIDDKRFRTQPAIFAEPDPKKRGFVEAVLTPVEVAG